MVKRIGGIRRKSRYKLKKEIRDRGKVGITRYFQSFGTGDKVYLDAEPAVQKGMYYTRFMGRAGVVKKKRGKCYEVMINDIGKQKILIIHPVHLKRA